MPDSRSRLPIAITMGDPNGIGPEVLLSAIADERIMDVIEPIVVGDPRVFEAVADRAGLGTDVTKSLRFESVEADSGYVHTPGKADPMAGAVAMKCIERAVDLCVQGHVAGMTTAPISKEVISKAGYDVPGHTEFIAERVGSADVLMMMVADSLRVGLVTTHHPLKNIPALITGARVERTLSMMAHSLKADFGITRPRIAVAGLNPHAGDGGVLGQEEIDIITPAMIRFQQSNDVELSGPVAADGFFGSGAWKRVDGFIAMYHDQGLVPFKALSFGKGVNVTAGLSIVRTSPDHGTGFDIAGSGVADPSSMKSALCLAADIARQRSTD